MVVTMIKELAVERAMRVAARRAILAGQSVDQFADAQRELAETAYQAVLIAAARIGLAEPTVVSLDGDDDD